MPETLDKKPRPARRHVVSALSAEEIQKGMGLSKQRVKELREMLQRQKLLKSH